MSIKRKQIGIFNNIVSGIGILALGIIVTIGSINLYTKVVNLLVYIFIIFGLYSLVNFLLNRKVVRNFQTLVLILSNISFGIIMIKFPKLPLSLIPIIFSLYLLINAMIRFINYLIRREVHLKSRFKELFLSMFFLISSLIFLRYPLQRLNLFIMIIGIYCILLGLEIIYELIIDLLPYNTKLKIRRRVKVTLPLFLEAFIPKRVFKNINKYIEEIKVDNKEINTSLKILIHLSNYDVNQFGHIDIMINDNVYSYGNYDRSTKKIFGGFGDGVLFVTNKKEKYIDFCLNNYMEAIVEYGIKLTNSQEKDLNNQIMQLMEDTYEWNPPVKVDKNIKKLYYADKLYKSTKAKFYKFKSSEFKKFFIAGVNCTYFINLLLKDIIFESLKPIGILSPGTYYEYLEENYNRKNSNVAYKKIYKKDSIGDLNDKDKK